MSPEERRAAIVRATLPLLSEHGANITTRQIAQAAEIAEGTVFRVFTDKEELLRTCIAQAFRTDDVVASIRAIPADQDLATLLVDGGLALAAHFTRLGELMRALATSGYDMRPDQSEHDATTKRHGPMDYMREPLAALTELIEPAAATLRLPPDELARMLLGTMFSLQLEDPDTDRRGPLTQRVDVLLHGAVER